MAIFWKKASLKSLFSLFLIFPHFYILSQTQLNFIPAQEVKVWLFQQELKNAWTGGLNNPQYSAIDLNKDGTSDLIVFDRAGDRILPFLYRGPTGTTQYQFAPVFQKAFPPLKDWMLTLDYNQDGLQDIFTGVGGQMAVYTQLHRADTFPVFSQIPILISTIREGITDPLLVSPTDLPAISDIDLDGDLDILSFDMAGSFVEYHQNRSKELYGHSDSLNFVRVDACWGGFIEALSDNTVQLNVLCKNGGSQGAASGGFHAGSSLLALDLDGDQDKDLMIGDVSFSNMIVLTNGGDSLFAEMISQTHSFPASLPISINIFPAAFFVDVNGDDKRDLLVAPNSQTNSEDAMGSWYYRNTGTDSDPIFSYIQDDFLQEEMIDVGSGSKPLILDYNGDGLQDLIIANDGSYSSGNFQSAIYLFQNTGTPNLPEFQLVTKDMGSLSLLNYQGHVFPALADLDGDNDLDMILGKANGTLDYFENISASPTDIFPIFNRLQTDYLGIDVGNRATPTLFDLNSDSLPDLIIAEQNNNLNYWEHSGSPSSMDFSFVTDSLGKLDISSSNNDAGAFIPQFIFIHDTLNLFLGLKNGHIARYNNITPTSAFILSDSMLGHIDVGRQAAPALNDMNADGKMDLIVGNQAGGLNLFWGSDSMAVNIDREIHHRVKINIFPNPSSGEIIIQPTKFVDVLAEFRLLDYSGREVFYLSKPPIQTSIQLPNIASGLYVATGRTVDGQTFSSLIRISR